MSDVNQTALVELQQQLKQAKHQTERKQQQYIEHKWQFDSMQSFILHFIRPMKRVMKWSKTLGGVVLRRRNKQQLYSSSYKRKDAANKLKPYKYHMYELGFRNKALTDMKQLYEQTEDRFLAQAIAWELALWYANQYTSDGCKQALQYLRVAIEKENNQDLLRKAAIIQAECYARIGEREEGKRIIQHMLKQQQHNDLYLAAANLETSIIQRLGWINQVYVRYGLQPITFTNLDAPTYDDLTTVPAEHSIASGPKVSVILPAYNAQEGIRTAIESILNQTWRNLELLIVDDCSSDNTFQVAEQYAEQDDRVSVFTTPNNSGPYIARNIALKEATGEFVTVNDADDWSHVEKIEKQVTHLIDNPHVIANTSEHSRLTEELTLYRRGTPGVYIFPNMSSLMFRREPVLSELGYWDSVRFAADGEFKRRLLKVFGQDKIIDLPTGPLSLPRQTVSSLTGSSAFGYNGFFMGARKEYVESFEAYHNEATNLYYPAQQLQRLFPVPEPMWPRREEKVNGSRYFDVVIAGDFRIDDEALQTTLQEIRIHQQLGLKTGLLQMASYNYYLPKQVVPEVRAMINGRDVQMLVYGEKVTTELFMVKQPAVLQEKQQYIPSIKAKTVRVIVDRLPKEEKVHLYDIRQCMKHLEEYVGHRGKWFPYNESIRQDLLTNHSRYVSTIKLASSIWSDHNEDAYEIYRSRLDEWLIHGLAPGKRQGRGRS